MYTQCPECQTAFRVTTSVLQKAGGRVRCGGCGNPFSALDHLFEKMPGAAASNGATGEAVSGTEPQNDDVQETSKALLETLDELTGGENIRIEDTGVEWRVLDEDDPDTLYQDSGIVEQIRPTAKDGLDDTGSQSSLVLRTPPSPTGERRYDDNTPLPDNFEDEEDLPFTGDTPRRRESDQLRRESDQPSLDSSASDLQVDLELGADDEWAELLDDDAVETRPTSDTADAHRDQAEDEVQFEAEAEAEAEDDAEAEAEDPAEAEVEDENEDEDDPENESLDASADEPEDDTEIDSLEDTVTGTFDTSATGTMPVDLDLQFDLQAEALGIDTTGRHKVDTDAPVVSEDEFEESEAEQDEPEEGELNEASSDHDSDDEEADEISESDIIEKLRESTGSFQRQIEAAQQALDHGKIEEYAESEIELEDSEDDLAEAESDEEDAEDKEAEKAPKEEFVFNLDVDESGYHAVQEEDDGDTVDARSTDESEDDELEEEPAANLSASNSEEEPLDDSDEKPGEAEDVEVAEEQAQEASQEVELTDKEKLSQTMIQAGIDPAVLDADNIETIVMEGEFVRGSLEKERMAAEQVAMASFDDPGDLADTYMMNKGKVRGGRRRTDAMSIGVIVSVVALTLLLAAQYIHGSRESLAAYGFFNQTVAPVYRVLGKPITPDWNVKGWQFETTRGSTDDDGQVLTIFSRITNASEEPLPYPLVQVSLTDRWEEIIGSKVLEPSEFLAGDFDPRKPVEPDATFAAVIAIDSPSAKATGFRLNVCYRVSPGRVRCATEDFKN